ncbi:MAG: OmpW/AlkL family protein [Phenylobacterium sp.]
MRISYAALSAALVFAPLAAQAQQVEPPKPGDWQVTVRVTDLAPTANDAIRTGSGGSTGLHVNVSDSFMPTLGFTYFLTDKLAVEGILGTTEHTVRAEGAGTSVKVHDTWVIPPVVTLQYRPLPTARFSPYVGAGLNGVIFYDGKDHNGFNVRLRNQIGTALQVGADYSLMGPWLLNADVKKVFVATKANINSGALQSDVHLDPWVVSLGVARRF